MVGNKLTPEFKAKPLFRGSGFVQQITALKLRKALEENQTTWVTLNI